MSIGIFYDTETSNFPSWKLELDDPKQPTIVQLAACLVDLETRETIASLDVIINPEWVIINKNAAEVHGISNEKAQSLGVKSGTAVSLFVQLWRMAAVRVAHNQRFDERMIAIALARTAGETSQVFHDWNRGKTICTMQLANPFTTAEGSIGSKWPKLAEACKILMNREIENAHSAMPDVLACMDLYFHCMDQLRKLSA